MDVVKVIPLNDLTLWRNNMAPVIKGKRSQYDLGELQPYIDDRWITARRHPDSDLSIYNYTPKTQWQGHWDDVTMACRGLILDGFGNVISRPFGKFFNLGEKHSGVKEVDIDQPFTVMQKVDGSLCISYPDNHNNCRLATRGSFTSFQAGLANEILDSMDLPKDWYNPEWTYLFELVHPDNRIVVNYGDQRKLVLLAVIETWSGEDVSRSLWPTHFEVVEQILRYQSMYDLVSEANNIAVSNDEGFVVKFVDGSRVKIKYAQYRALHRLLTGTSWKSIWQCLREGYSLHDESGYELAPDDFKLFVHDVSWELTKEYNRIEGICRNIVKNINTAVYYDPEVDEEDLRGFRKRVAEYILEAAKESDVPTGPLFRMYDNKDYEDAIWKHLEPVGLDKVQPFMRDGEL